MINLEQNFIKSLEKECQSIFNKNLNIKDINPILILKQENKSLILDLLENPIIIDNNISIFIETYADSNRFRKSLDAIEKESNDLNTQLNLISEHYHEQSEILAKLIESRYSKATNKINTKVFNQLQIFIDDYLKDLEDHPFIDSIKIIKNDNIKSYFTSHLIIDELIYIKTKHRDNININFKFDYFRKQEYLKVSCQLIHLSEENEFNLKLINDIESAYTINKSIEL